MNNKRENETGRDKQGVIWYREKIVDMVERIENIGTLQYLDRFIELFLEKWG